MGIQGDAGVATPTESTAAEQSGLTPEQLQASSQQSDQPGQEQQPAGDSGAGATEEPPKSALEAVTRVMEKARTDAAEKAKVEAPPNSDIRAEAHEGDVGDEGQGDPKDKDLTGYIDKDEWAALPQKTQKRIGQFREKIRTLESQLGETSPKVQTYDHLTGYMRSNGITRENFAEGLEIIRLIQQDPIEAYKRLQPIVEQLQAQVGEVLPQDLREAVDNGRINEDYARELARNRKAAELRENQLRQRDENDEHARAVQQFEQTRSITTSAVDSWEQAWRQSDPDYSIKAPMVWERMALLMQQSGVPRTPQHAVEIAKRAKQDVEDRLRGIAPARRAKTPVVQSGAAVQTVHQPNNALEAAQLALQKTRQV